METLQPTFEPVRMHLDTQDSRLFLQCRDFLAGIAPDLDEAGRQFLETVNYLPDETAAGNAIPEPVSRNRQALLSLAATFSRAFRLPLPHAPGAAFFGAMGMPSALGITGYGNDAVGFAGRGMTFGQAFESCVGEAAEYFSFIERDIDPLLTPPERLAAPGDADLCWAFDGIGIDPGTSTADLTWVAAMPLDGEPGGAVRFPSELVLRRPAGRRVGKRPAESTGVGAGPTLDAALYSGLMECIERDAIALWWYGGNNAARVCDTALQRIGFTRYAEHVRAGSNRPFWFLDLTTDLDLPVIAALSSTVDGHSVVTGFCARVDIRHAVLGAFLEMCQMELAQQISRAKLEQRGPEAMQAQYWTWIERFKSFSCDAYPHFLGQESLDPFTSEGVDDPMTTAVERLRVHGLRAYWVDLTRPEVGVACARVLVPGLQSPKPDWISERLKAAAAREGRTPAEFAAMLPVI
ncbi:MAG: YcaO-like family protein [Pseudomonadota bacterium]